MLIRYNMRCFFSAALLQLCRGGMGLALLDPQEFNAGPPQFQVGNAQTASVITAGIEKPRKAPNLYTPRSKQKPQSKS